MYACARESWTDRGAWSHCCRALCPASQRPLGSSSLPGKPSQWRTQSVRHNACLHLLIQSTPQHCWPEVICVFGGAKMMICEPARVNKYVYNRDNDRLSSAVLLMVIEWWKMQNNKHIAYFVLFLFFWVGSFIYIGWTAKYSKYNSAKVKYWHEV